MPPLNYLSSLISLLEWCSVTKNLLKLQTLHGGAIKLGLSHREIVRSKMVSAYASCGQMSDACLIFSFCNRRSTFLYNTLIRGHSSVEQFHISLSVFAEMMATGKAIDCNTLPSVLKSIAGLSALGVGRRVHVAVLVSGFAFDTANCNALITMYAKCGDLVSARKVFEVMPVRNTISWSALIGGYGMHGRFSEACELFERMIELGFFPDEAAFTTVLAACSHGGFVEAGKAYFEMMRKRFRIRPNKVHYTCMVDMFARAGRMKEAKEVIEGMDIEPDEAILRALCGPSKVPAGLVYCMDYLEKNVDWLESKLEPLIRDHYLLFDFPGQVELFFLHESAKKVIMKLIKKLNLRLTAVHLVDAHLCSDAGKYVSALMLSLSTMLHLELPHVNVLSKIDLIGSYGTLAFNLDFYTDAQDLSYLQNCLDQDPRAAKYRKLTKELCEVIEDYSLVDFTTLDIQDKESVGNLVKLIDKTNGYIFADIDASAVEFSKIAVRQTDWDYYRVAAVQEKYMKDDEIVDISD